MKKSLKIVFAILILMSIIFVIPKETLADFHDDAPGNFDFEQFDGKGSDKLNPEVKRVMRNSD